MACGHFLLDMSAKNDKVFHQEKPYWLILLNLTKLNRFIKLINFYQFLSIFFVD